MTEKSRRNVNMWLTIGAIVLIILLLVWLTLADFAGDTDVAALLTNPFIK